MNDEQPLEAYDTEKSKSETPRLSSDRFYRALASTQRRRLLSLLCDEREETVDELATVLTGWDATTTDTMATPADHERLTIELVHSHLPLLEESGLVTYDRERATVAIEPLEETVVELIHRSVDRGADRSSS